MRAYLKTLYNKVLVHIILLWYDRIKPHRYLLLLFLGILILIGILVFRNSSTGKQQLFSDDSDRVLAESGFYARYAFGLVFSDPEKARRISYEQLAAIEHYEADVYRIAFNNIIGASYLSQAKYNAAMDYFYRALELSLETNELFYRAHLYNNIGAVYLLTGKYKDALDFMLNAERAYDVINDTIGVFRSVNNIGRIYFEVNDLNKAIEYFRDAYKGFIAHDFVEGISSAANFMAQYFWKKEEPDSALYYFDLAAEKGIKSGNQYGMSVIYFEMGNFFMESDRYQQAISSYLKSDSLARELGSLSQSGYPMLGLAKTYLKTGDIDTAISYAEMAREIAILADHDKIKYKVNELFAQIYEKTGDIQRAFEYHKLAGVQKALLFDQAEIYQLYNIEIQKLSTKMEHQDLIVEKQQLILSKRKKNMMLISSVSGLLIIILSLGYYMHLTKIKQEQKNRINEHKLKLTMEKNRAAIEAEIQERKRLGMELHDGIGSMLSITKLNVSNVLEDNSLSDMRKQELLLKTANNLDEVMKEMQHISNNLAPLVLFEKGFAFAVKNLAAKIKNLKKYNVSLNIIGLDSNMRPSLQHALYRTIQEVLNNIILHANASEITIEIFQGQDDITVIIEDNGRGFKKKENNAGMGLKSAISRIEGLNGVFYIDSVFGRGTIVSIILPLYASLVSE